MRDKHDSNSWHYAVNCAGNQPQRMKRGNGSVQASLVCMFIIHFSLYRINIRVKYLHRMFTSESQLQRHLHRGSALSLCVHTYAVCVCVLICSFCFPLLFFHFDKRQKWNDKKNVCVYTRGKLTVSIHHNNGTHRKIKTDKKEAKKQRRTPWNHV